MAPVPDLPDAAFDAVVERIVTFLQVTPAGQQPDMDAFCQSVGLRGQRDEREWHLGAAIVATTCGVPIEHAPADLVSAHVQGITTGLLLAQAADWDVPVADGE